MINYSILFWNFRGDRFRLFDKELEGARHQIEEIKPGANKILLQTIKLASDKWSIVKEEQVL